MTPSKAKPKKGKLKRNNVRLESHEERTVDFLRKQGYDIELIPPSNSPKSKTPDLMMQGLAWEMKSPTSNNLKTIERMFLRGLKQSQNLIIDIRGIKTKPDTVLGYLKRLFSQTKSSKKMIIIYNGKSWTFKK